MAAAILAPDLEAVVMWILWSVALNVVLAAEARVLKPPTSPTLYIAPAPVRQYYVVPVYQGSTYQGPVYQNCGPRG